MNTEIATTERDRKIAKTAELSPEEIAIIKNTVAKGTTDLELAFFLNVAKSYELSPFKKEIWCYRDNKGNLIVFAGRDGHLSAAQRDPRWNGIASSEVRENDNFTMDIPSGKVGHTYGWKDRGKIVGAYAICKPKGCEIATIEWVTMEAYDKGYNTWKSDPAAMIKKVAETHALKKAYGLSGLASEYDFEVVNDTAYPANIEGLPDINKVSYVEGLIKSSTYDHEWQARKLREIPGMNHAELDELISNLQVNQLDAIHETGRYSQTDLKLQ